jgi:hypothetical protein
MHLNLDGITISIFDAEILQHLKSELLLVTCGKVLSKINLWLLSSICLALLLYLVSVSSICSSLTLLLKKATITSYYVSRIKNLIRNKRNIQCLTRKKLQWLWRYEDVYALFREREVKKPLQYIYTSWLNLIWERWATSNNTTRCCY